MRHGGLVVAGLLTAALMLSGCSGGGDAYALRGTPQPRTGTSSGNFLISGKDCKYVTEIGFYSADVQVLTYPCTVTADEENALGDKHSHVTIDIKTAKGTVTAKIDGTTAGMVASQIPDLGNNYPFPPNWAVAPLAQPLTLRNNDGSASVVVVQVSGGECAMTVNNAPVTCGLSYWSDGAFSVWVPALLISPDYASYVIGLNFGRTSPGQWALARAMPGFPATFGEVTPKK